MRYTTNVFKMERSVWALCSLVAPSLSLELQTGLSCGSSVVLLPAPPSPSCRPPDCLPRIQSSECRRMADPRRCASIHKVTQCVHSVAADNECLFIISYFKYRVAGIFVQNWMEHLVCFKIQLSRFFLLNLLFHKAHHHLSESFLYIV